MDEEELTLLQKAALEWSLTRAVAVLQACAQTAGQDAPDAEVFKRDLREEILSSENAYEILAEMVADYRENSGVSKRVAPTRPGRTLH